MTTTLYFIITGMTCGGCVNTVTNLLNTHTFVNHVSIDLNTGLATVDVSNNTDDKYINDTIQQSIEEIGFDCAVPTQQQADRLIKQIQQQKQLSNDSMNDMDSDISTAVYPSLGTGYEIHIEYCTSCGYLESFSTVKQAIQQTFPKLSNKVMGNMQPPRMKSFQVTLYNTDTQESILLYSKIQTGRLPETNEILNSIRREVMKHTSYNPLNLLKQRATASDAMYLSICSITGVISISLLTWLISN